GCLSAFQRGGRVWRFQTPPTPFLSETYIKPTQPHNKLTPFAFQPCILSNDRVNGCRTKVRECRLEVTWMLKGPKRRNFGFPTSRFTASAASKMLSKVKDLAKQVVGGAEIDCFCLENMKNRFRDHDMYE